MFCRRSYNHIDTEYAPCMRCVDSEDFSVADQLGCISWPKADANSLALIAELRDYVSSGAVHIYTQSRSQTSVAQDHFNTATAIEQVGLWCSDWDEHFERFEKLGVQTDNRGQYDIVYHGSRDLAKGLDWILSLAARTPDLKYLVPLDRGEVNFTGPPNATIQPMRWDEGLFDAIKGARMTIAPSLWTAPCEGALIKSVVTTRLCAVVDNPTAFSSEIPEDVVLKLPPDPAEAADVVTKSLADAWQPKEKARQEWVEAFKLYHRAMTKRILN